jgi:hypothetical protein
MQSGVSSYSTNDVDHGVKNALFLAKKLWSDHALQE